MRAALAGQRGVSLLELVIGIVIAALALATLAVIIPVVVDQTEDMATASKTQAARSCAETLMALKSDGSLELDDCDASGPQGWVDPDQSDALQAMSTVCDTSEVIAQCSTVPVSEEEAVADIRVRRQNEGGSLLLHLELPFTPEAQ